MSFESKLAHLGWLCGIHRDYWDVWGQQHFLQPETERVLLGAMGFDVRDETSVDGAIATVERAKWSRTLPPVVVRTCNQSPTVPITVPAAFDLTQLAWEIAEEDGTTHAGSGRWEFMTELERGDFDGAAWVRYCFTLAVILEPGYHRFTILPNEAFGGATCDLIITPEQCYFPAERPRTWGVALQLYSLRSSQNWGVGDFGDLRRAVNVLAALGADVIGVNPLHALNLEAAADASPYSPSSRSFLNPLYLDVDTMEDFGASDAGRAMRADPDVDAALARLRATEFVDYPNVARLKQRGFDIAYQHFRMAHLTPLQSPGQAPIIIATLAPAAGPPEPAGVRCLGNIRPGR